MATLFEQLEYNFTDTGGTIQNYNDDVLEKMDKMPPLLEEWQYDDLKNEDSDVTNYLQNPTKQVTQQIIAKVNEIIGVSSGVTNLGSIQSACLNIVDHYVAGSGEFDPPVFVQGSSSKYIEHCDRLSGLVKPNEDTALLPHYDMAIGIGKSLVYLMYQADGIQNNAPILGSFTSILIGGDLEQKMQLIIDYPDLIENSITCVPDGDTGNTICSSNLTSQVITQIQTNLNSIQTLFNGRRLHDENYYANASALLEKFQEMKRYKAPGQTETELLTNILGTERLKSNLL